MKLTEARLRAFIRGVIRESMDYDPMYHEQLLTLKLSAYVLPYLKKAFPGVVENWDVQSKEITLSASTNESEARALRDHLSDHSKLIDNQVKSFLQNFCFEKPRMLGGSLVIRFSEPTWKIGQRVEVYGIEGDNKLQASSEGEAWDNTGIWYGSRGSHPGFEVIIDDYNPDTGYTLVATEDSESKLYGVSEHNIREVGSGPDFRMSRGYEQDLEDWVKNNPYRGDED
tara:strand:+ start:458 stop:1138 length:681 start_codon:yes stop_codon:yes gene_type:complete